MPWDFAVIMVVLGAVVPWLGKPRVTQVVALLDMSKHDRLAVYASTMTFQWATMALVVWRAGAHLLSALLFALAHLYEGSRDVAEAFAVGANAATVRLGTGTLVPSIAAHFITDFTLSNLAPIRIRMGHATTCRTANISHGTSGVGEHL